MNSINQQISNNHSTGKHFNIFCIILVVMAMFFAFADLGVESIVMAGLGGLAGSVSIGLHLRNICLQEKIISASTEQSPPPAYHSALQNLLTSEQQATTQENENVLDNESQSNSETTLMLDIDDSETADDSLIQSTLFQA